MSLTLPTVCCVLLVASLQSLPFPGFPERVTIEGRRNPEQLPEYLVWRSGFRALATFTSPSDDLFVNVMGLSPTDIRLVMEAAAAQAERDAACERNQRRVIEQMPQAKSAELIEATQKVVLDCRWQVLLAQERLLLTLSAEGQVAIVGWMNTHRSSITVHVFKHELEFFRKPR